MAVNIEGLHVDQVLYDFVVNEALPGTDITAEAFWSGLSALVHEMGPRNRELLATRARLQNQIDVWHRVRNDAGRSVQTAEYAAFLTDIGYLAPEGAPFEIDTDDVDVEIATIAGPQLVVPVSNARYAINAANARWGSLYDAFYGTDALGSPPPAGPYSDDRGTHVIATARQFLDDYVPLDGIGHRDTASYSVDMIGLVAITVNGAQHRLVDPALFVGFQGPSTAPSRLLFRHHGLGIQIVIDRSNSIGALDQAGVADVLLEAAVTVIMDCEDSVAAVDADDKVQVYRNWLGLMKGTLTEEVTKDGRTFTRTMAADQHFTSVAGEAFSVRSRGLMLVRNVGLLMTNPAVVDRDGYEAPEGLLDAMITVLAALHDARSANAGNSRHASIYIVKPKMHGPDEVAFTNEVFSRVEQSLGLPLNTVKLGIMDEERRTSLNLAECIRQARHRVVFVNTGFLDRTGDEIHTSMEAGPMVRKAAMKSQLWITAYEARNVDTALACGLRGKAQIGKGMWAAPDLMADMVRLKIEHPQAGANCAWVPSPTAATLHAMHYHAVDVAAVQARLAGGERFSRNDLLQLPIAPVDCTADEIRAEVENNAQGILGYVVRWVDQGVGCSKVPDINGVGLMEDRATCRISSQHIANWLHHGVVTSDEVEAAFRKMAAVVDSQNAGDPLYEPMAPMFDGVAYRAACALAFEGIAQPSGYTEPILHTARAVKKAGLIPSP